MSDERIKKAHELAEKYGTAERECRWHESGLDADDCFRDLMIYVKGLVARIAELEAVRKKAFDLVRKLRMYCIYANWDNPDTEDEFNEFDAEVCEYLSEYKVCVDQLTAHSDIERQDDKWIPEVQE